MVIDAHVHLPTGDAYRSLRAKKEALLREMERVHIDTCVVIADSWPVSDIGSTEECVSLFCGDAPAKVRVVGGISPLVEYREGLDALRGYLEAGQIAGIKLYTGHEAFYLSDERLDDAYSLALRYRVPVLFHTGWENSRYGDAGEAEKIAERYPDLTLVACHCWYPDIAKCRRLLRYPNVVFGLSSLADDPDTAAAIAGKVRELALAVPDRVVYGSDAFGCSMEKHIEFVKGLRLPPDIEEKVFFRNAQRIYRL